MTTNFLLKIKFDGESDVPAINHLFNFIKKCEFHRIVANNVKYRLFVHTFKGQIRKWFEMLPTKSIHSWDHVMEMFLFAHQSYNYDELCNEIESLWKERNESLDDFHSRLLQIYYIFHDEHRPSKKYFHVLFTYLLSISFSDFLKEHELPLCCTHNNLPLNLTI